MSPFRLIGPLYLLRLDRLMQKALPADRRAYVYLMLRSDGAIKIGHSNDIAVRRANLRSSGHDITGFLHWIVRPRSEAYAIEQLAHWIYRDARLDGEWFSLTGDDAARVLEDAAAQFDAGARAPKFGDDPMNARTKIAITLDAETVSRLNAWRRRQETATNSANAVRCLLAEALSMSESRFRDQARRRRIRSKGCRREVGRFPASRV